MNKIREFFGIYKLGCLEFIIALYPILSVYNYGKVPLYLLLPFGLDIILLVSNRSKTFNYDLKPFFLLIGYLLLHFILWIFIINNPPSYSFNSNIQQFVIMFSLIIILPYLDLKKLSSSINLVGMISACGLVYHAVELMLGHSITTITLPFMPEPNESSRIFNMVSRPVSFFTEPQTYVSYMIIPLFLALSRKNLFWAICISLTVLMSGSTTGIAMIAIMFGSYIIITKVGMFYRFLLTLTLVGLGCFLLTSDYAALGLDKMNETTFSENMRIANGFLVAKFMSLPDLILGVSYANATDFCYNTGVTGQVILDGTGSVFVSAIWIAIIQYGLIGLFIYLNLYYQMLKINKTIFSYWLCIVIVLFTNPDFIGSNFLFILLFSYTYVNQIKKSSNEKDLNSYNTICK